MKKLMLSMAVMLSVALTVQAVPAKPGTKKAVQLANGKTVELTLHGDEHFSFYADANDQLFQLKDGNLISLSKEQVHEQWVSARQHRLSLPATARSKAPRRVGKPSGNTTGKHRGLVILVQYTDVQFVTENPKEFFTRFFNEPGFDYNGMTGSVRDYFLAQSYNQLEIDFDVVGPFTTAHEMEWYGQQYTDATGRVVHDRRPQNMVAEGVDAASKEVNFSNYDWDKDGEVDQVFVIYAGYSQAQGADASTIWPHESHLGSLARTYNRVLINTYGCSSEMGGDGRSVGKVDGIGTACHEFSHCLGLPDVYDTNYVNFGMNTWDIMDYGSYNNDARTPAGYTAYERWFSNWMEPTELKDETQITDMKPLAETPEAYVLYNDAHRDEFYVLENRQPIGYDKYVGGHGLLVLHVDYDEGAWSYNSVNVVTDHERYTVIAADNKRTRYDIAGDPYPGTSRNTSLTNLTTPAATVFHTNTDGRKLMNKAIEKITENTTTHTVSFLACHPELKVPVIDQAACELSDDSYKIVWGAIEGATKYEVELTTMNKASSDPKEALQREFSFDKFYNKTQGFSDVGTKLSEYGLSGWTGTKIFTSPQLMLIGTSSANGTLKTATWNTPQSSNFTVVLRAAAVKNAVTGKLQVGHGENGGTASFADVDMNITDEGLYVFHFTDIRSSLFFMNILPTGRMYLKYLAIYDGIWELEDLQDAAGSRPFHAANVTTQVFTTTETTYTFTDLKDSKSYAYRVRSADNDNRYSDWCTEYSFELSSGGFLLGDVNGDYKVDVSDYIGIANRILAIPQEGFNEKAGDIDGNGVIDVSDYIGVANIILTGNPYGNTEAE